jgi:hypothetical protein
MALESGGFADKLGNRYEGRWVVRQMLRVLTEELRAVTLEEVGDNEQGVDLWVERVDGGRQAQQCKIRNGRYERWTVADLARRSILEAMREHLEREASNEFALVTAVPCTVLHDISESARYSSGDPEAFYEHQIQSVGEDRRQVFGQFCQHLALDPAAPASRAAAYSMLRRLFIELWPDTRTTREELHDQARTLVSGDPQTIVAVLSEFALENLRARLDAPRIRRHLADRGLEPRQLAHDERVAPGIESLQAQFIESIESDLIAGHLIHRAETDAILNALTESTLVALHGSPGRGKTGVLFELARTCAEREWLCLALRLDRQEPRDTPRRFGLDLGLPESPVRCLAEMAGDRPAVLILDQLDAIRWTSRHSLNAFEVCKSLVREVRSLRSLGAPISVVVACRTYDMQNDPEIKNWLASEKAKDGSVVEIGVEPLSNETVASVVESVGHDPTSLSARQAEILRSPQQLAMWVRIVQAGGGVEFQNRVQLMREFWLGRFREISERGVPESGVQEVLTAVIDFMEQNGRVSAPRTLVSNHAAMSALCSAGILREAGGQVTFAHQSYLDHEIATRVVRAIHAAGSDIVEWLGPRERQSLFRREQLRQALCLLSEERPDQFVATIQPLLSSDGVRFHLKHLCLEMIGQIERPSEALVRYLLELAQLSDWREQVLGTAFIGNAAIIRTLVHDGVITAWLQSDDRRPEALWLLRTVAEKIPDDVVQVLRPLAEESDEWRTQILGCLAWNAEDDSDAMFELRLNLARVGVFRDFISWKKLSANRVLRLLDAVMASCGPDDFRERFGRTSGRRSRIEHWSDDDVTALVGAARNAPDDAWRMLSQHIVRLAPDTEDADGGTSINRWLDSDVHGVRRNMEGMPHSLVRAAIEAGRVLAVGDGELFWRETEGLRGLASPVIRCLLIESYSALSDELADAAISWLIDAPENLRAGSGSNEPEWMPAARMLEALSSECSDETFDRAERTIIGYHEPDERAKAEYWLTTWKRGYFGDYWGRAQHFLLPALSEARRSDEANALIGVLERKFEEYPPERFTRGLRSRGGFVGSTLPDDLLRLSDEAWLGIISNPAITEDGDHRWRQVGDDHIEESSVRQFSRNLQSIAKRFPERFGRLALRFPAGAHASYRAAILDGLKQTKPTDVPAEEQEQWRPAPVDLIEEVMRRFGDDADREYAIAFCWLMNNRAEDHWSPNAISRLTRYALDHPDPGPDDLVVGSGQGDFSAANASVSSLLTNALNTVRSVAVLSIGQQIRNHPELLEQFRGPIERLCDDPSPVVRTAIVEACLPVLGIDKDFAIARFCAASDGDLRIAASRAGVYFFNCGIESHNEQLSQLVRGMIESSWNDVMEEGAEEVTARWLFNGYFGDELERCAQGSAAHRKGLAQIAAHFVTSPEYFEKCERLLMARMDDADSDVRSAVNSIARSSELLQDVNGLRLVLRLVESQSFRDDPTALIFGLDDFAGELLPLANVLFAMCDQFTGPLRDASRDASHGIRWDMSHFLPILIRLYEQAEELDETGVVQRCLDAWDEMFLHRVGVVRELADAIT